MIYCTGVVKSYGNVRVLKGADLELEAGKVASIMGSSGAGKSTLLHLIGTLDKPDEGKILLNDKDVFSLSHKQLALFRNRSIGFIFQFHHLLPELTALENVSLPGFIAGSDEAEVNKRAKHLLDFLGLSHRLDHKPSELSGGEQQRVALARALINSPKILLADEPTGNLDQQNAKEVLGLLLQIRNEMQMTLLIVTHDPEIASKAEINFFMKDGLIFRH
jgi:lipoprotein-releasing system ATP-binding protein